MNLYLAIGSYLENNGITQTYLSERSGMTTNALNLSLKGKRKLTADEYIKICDALKVPYDLFVKNCEQLNERNDKNGTNHICGSCYRSSSNCNHKSCKMENCYKSNGGLLYEKF